MTPSCRRATGWRSSAAGCRTRPTSASCRALLRQAASALYLFTPAADREDGARGFADLLGEQAASRPAGSDHQLAFVRAFVGIARTDAQLASVARAALDGSGPFAGLTVDTDLRWALLHRLVATGRADDDAIDA